MKVLLRMAKGLRRRLRGMAKANSPFPEERPTSIQDMPTEVLEYIISFLPMLSIPKLMVNRAFRQTCERVLYRDIHLPSHPGRTLHLCKTFVRRPDLALLVRDLDVFLAWAFVTPERRGTRIFQKFSIKNKIRTFTPIEALALATNVRSFNVEGIPWAFHKDMSLIRELASGMKLTRLAINKFRSLPNPNSDFDKEVISYLYAILQAQPLLEHLELPNSFVARFIRDYPSPPNTLVVYPPSETYPPLLIKWPEMTNLRSLTSSASIAASFIPATPKLEKLSIHLWDDERFLFIPYPEERGRRIRSLALKLPFGGSWTRSNLGTILNCFPSVETLIIRSWWPRVGGEVISATEYMNEVLLHCHVLPLLRRLDMHDVSFNRLDTGRLDEPLADLKLRCPLLESAIDPFGSIWAYPAAASHQPSPGLRCVGRLSRSPKIPPSDLPNPETSRKRLSQITSPFL